MKEIKINKNQAHISLKEIMLLISIFGLMALSFYSGNIFNNRLSAGIALILTLLLCHQLSKKNTIQNG